MNWQRFTHPPDQDRIYWGWFMLGIGIMMGVLTVLLFGQHRYGLALWDFAVTIVDFFLAWVNFGIYNEWKEKQNKPLTNPEDMLH